MLNQTILSYEGPLTFSTIDSLITQFKHAAKENNIKNPLYKKLLSLMVESLENVSKYNVKELCGTEGTGSVCPSFHIIRNRNSIELVTSNPVNDKDISELRERIEKVNNKSRNELRELYESTIGEGQFTSKGGAGLGFIEMAKTSGRNLEYSFKKLPGDYSLYTFRISIDVTFPG
ncbi:MAG: SiaB family protein kinase [Bacteroidales bacterium]|nr:SiaB family protein kinase [Bacteroidales bacterium]